MKRYKYSETEILDIFKDVVKTKKRFKGYNKTQEIYKFWWSIYTGIGHEDIFKGMIDMKKYKQGEKEKKVRYIYNPSSPKLVNKAISTYSHIHRVDNILDSFEIIGTVQDLETKTKKIQSDLSCFYGQTSARQYLSERIIHWNVYDPNSFLVVNFEKEGKKNYPYPIHIPSQNVMHREYKNGTLQYLIYESIESCNIKKGDKIEDGNRYNYWCLTKDNAYRISVADKGTIGFGVKDETTQTKLNIEFGDEVLEKMSIAKDDVQVIQEKYPIALEEIPAMSVGYVRSLPDENNHCDDFIFESLLYPAKSPFLELIKRKRHKDLHLELHGIAQKFAFVPECKWKSKKDGLSCVNGYMENGKECPACKGSNVQQYHNDEQDIITIPIKDLTKDQYLALKDLTYYQQIDFQVIKLNVDEYEKAEHEVLQAIANAPIYESKSVEDRVEKTKYEVQANRSTMNTVLHKFGKQDEIMYKFCVRMVSGYNDVKSDQINNKFQYPNDFSLENVSDLVVQLEGLVRSDGPELAKLKIKTKIMHKLCVDDPQGFKKWKSREYHRPFKSLSPKDKAIHIQTLPILSKPRILYLYFDRIFNDIELEKFPVNTPKNHKVDFCELPVDLQIKKVDEKIVEYISVYKSEYQDTASIIQIEDPEPNASS